MDKKTTINRIFDIKRIIIFVLLFAASIVLSFALQRGSRFLLHVDKDNEVTFSQTNDYQELHKGQILSGEIKTPFSYLGIVSLRFNTFSRINNGNVVFRIKEKGQKEWYYQNTYKINQFQDNQFFTFGFPLIKESKNKPYIFQVQSLNGEKGNAVALSSIDPKIATTFQYTPEKLLSLRIEGITFIVLKYMSGFSGIKNFIIILSPFLMYFLIRQIKRARIHFSAVQKVLGTLTVVSLMYIFFLGKVLPGQSINDFRITVVLLLLWIIFVFKYKIESTFWIIFAMLYLSFVSIVLLFLHRPDIADRASILAYSFLILGIIHAFSEYFFKPKSHIQIGELMPSLIDKKRINSLVRRGEKFLRGK